MKRRIAIALVALVLVLSFSLALALPATANGPSEVWVDATYCDGCGNDGHAWGYDAFATIQEGINAVTSPGTVHVAAGTYHERITLKDGVTVQGAGAGDNPSVNSIIDGDNGGAVVTADGVGTTTVISGFTITHGSNPLLGGGGMRNNNASPTVSNCTFCNNSATWVGGGMANLGSSPTVTNCTFTNNTLGHDGNGGGMGSYDSSPIVSNCIFDGNEAFCGGGIYNNGSSLTLTNCTFSGNEAGQGAGMYISSSSPTVTNCIFSDNVAAGNGGGMHNTTGASPTVTNCTFSGNTAGSGDGMYNNNSSPTVTNCILWNGGDEIFNEDVGSVPVVTYCDVEGGYGDGTNIITGNPLFVNAAGGDFHLQGGSPCIDAGNNGAPSLPATDFEGDARILNGVVDMGVDEHVPPTEVWVAPPPTGDDANPGTEAEPFATIQRGIDRVASPGTVHVAAGEYHELITLEDGVEVLGAGADVTTIDGDAGGSVVTASGCGATTVLSGFTITDGGNTNEGGGMHNINSSPTVSDCIFSANTAVWNGGGMYNYNSSLTMTNCVFTGNTVTMDYGANGAGMFNMSNSNAKVTNCIFYNNTSAYCSGGMTNYSSAPTLTNCTFYGNTAGGGGVGGGMLNQYSAVVTVTNCILWGDSPQEMFNADGTTVTVSYCDVEQVAGVYSGTGNINAAPLFVDAAGGDFHLTPGSPCIDAGDNSAAFLPDADFEGDDRILDGIGDAEEIVDMGVDEYVLPTPTEVWVDDDWDGTAVGTEVETGKFFGYNAFASIQDGIDAVTGSTVHVAAGTYNERITLEDGVQVLGAGAGVTTIDGGGSGHVVIADGVGSSTRLDGFTIRNGNVVDNGGGMRNINGAATVVSNCIFYNNEAYNGSGIYNDNSSPTVTNCIFYNNSAYSGGGMFNDNSSPTVTNCTFYNNSANGGKGIFNFNSTNPTITNCILWDGGGEIYNDGSTPTVSYCDVQGSYSGTGNINSDPLFVNANSGNFHLQPDSPCVDAGDDIAVAGITTDFEGDARIVNGTVDMGVDERTSIAEVWVDDDYCATCANDGHTWGYDAFDAIQDGVNAVDIGGTVNVYAGDYTEHITITDKSVTVESDSGDWHDTTIDLPSFVFALLGDGGGQFVGDVTISGFAMTGSQYGIYIPYGLATGSSLSVSNCFIHGNSDTGIYANDVLDGDIFIDDCIIADNGPDLTGIHLCDVRGTVEITDSFIGAYWDAVDELSYAGNNGNGITIDRIYTTGSVLIDNNKIVNNVGDGIADFTTGCYGELTITDNIIGAYDYDLTTGNGYFDGNGSNGISIDYVGPDGVVTIEGNKIAQNTEAGVYFLGASIAGEVTINDNYIGAWTDYTTVGDTLYTRTYSGNGDEGIYIGDVDASGSLTIINNKVGDNDDVGLTIVTTSGDTLILANHFGSWTQDIPGGTPVTYDGNDGAGILVMQIPDGRLLIQGNTVADTIGSIFTGIHIEEAADTADVRVKLNNIVDNDGNGLYYAYGGAGYIENLDAENNWWGDASGPYQATTNLDGTGDEVSDHVDYDPWLQVSVTGAKAGTVTNGTLDNVAGADTEVIVTGSATVTSASYSDNPGSSGFGGDIGKYIDVSIDDDAGVTEIEIRLYYTDADIAGLDEASLSLRWWNGTEWVECTDRGVNATDIPGPPAYSGYIWAKIRVDTTPSLADLVGSIFGGGGASLRPHSIGDTTAPQISYVSLCSEGVTETTADICWTTNEKSTSQVEYWASPVKLSPLDTTLVTEHHVQLTDLTPGTTYYYRAMSRDKAGNLAKSGIYSFTTLEATLPSAIFASSDLTISPAEVAIGETVTISVLVTNSGNAAGSYELTLEINGVAEETKEVTLEAGASQSVSFTVSRGEAGSYSVAVDGLSGSFSVTAPEDNEPGNGVAEVTEEEGSTNWPLIGGVIAAVVIALIILVVVRRRAS